MEQRRQIPRLFTRICIALTLLGLVLRTACMLFCFDADVGYFQSGILPTLSNALYFIAVTAAILFVALTPKDTLPTTLHTPGRLGFALVTGLALGFFTVLTLLLPQQLAGNSGKITLIANLLGLPAAFYFIASARKDDRYPDWLSFLGFLPVFWCIAAAADTYFDAFVTMNSPVKVALQMGFLGFMLIMLAELRFRVGKVAPRYSAAFLAVGSFACLVGSFPLLCAIARSYFSGEPALPVSLRYAMYAVVVAAAGVYGLYLLIRYIASPVPAVTEDSADIPTDLPHNAE